MWYEREFFPRSRPRAARGGIKAQSKRGQFGESWWAKRWIAVLESFQIGGRLQRGRSYARRGQVLSIDVGKGKVDAKVQGSQPTPYKVSIQVKALSDKEWGKVVHGLAGQAVFTAKLLAGEMPQDVETVFQKAGLSLFPEKLGDLKTSCSCPDYSNPCKHIAAVYYLLGEEFDRDPFLLFQLRGLGRDELMARLQETQQPAAEPDENAAAEAAETAPAGEPLAEDAAGFWSVGDLTADWLGDVQPPPASAAWPKRWAPSPSGAGEERFLDAVEPMYRQAARKGLSAVEGEPAS